MDMVAIVPSCPFRPVANSHIQLHGVSSIFSGSFKGRKGIEWNPNPITMMMVRRTLFWSAGVLLLLLLHLSADDDDDALNLD